LSWQIYAKLGDVSKDDAEETTPDGKYQGPWQIVQSHGPRWKQYSCPEQIYIYALHRLKAYGVVASVKYSHKVDRHVSAHMICHCSRGRNQRRQRTLEMPCLLCQSAVMEALCDQIRDIRFAHAHDRVCAPPIDFHGSIG